jgi:hypothetical protein
VTGLTDRDRRVIARARALAELQGADAIRQYLGDAAALTYDSAMAYSCAFGEAQELLVRLTLIAERRGSNEDQAAEAIRRLGEIRALLAEFDWEYHDRQLALEAIERIMDGGQA